MRLFYVYVKFARYILEIWYICISLSMYFKCVWITTILIIMCVDMYIL